MPDGESIGRLARRAGAKGEAALPASDLDAVARNLKEAVDRTARSLVLERWDAAPSPSEAIDVERALPDHQLPQILQQQRAQSVPVPGTKDRMRAQMLAPAILVGSLLAVSVLMSASLTHTGWLDSSPRPKPAESSEPFRAGRMLVAAEAVLEPTAATALAAPGSTGDVDLRALLETCERMIAAGDMAGARRELARAAEAGSAGARFALAETFDPNVLAAWGLRDRVADVGVARRLYEQALASGDSRARLRIDALGGEH